MAKTNVVRLGLIAGGGAVAVVAIVAGVFFLEYGGITKDIPLDIEIPGLTDSAAVERVVWPQLKEGRTAELDVPPTLEEIDELLAGRRNSLIAGGGGELEMDLYEEQAELDMTIPLFIPEETPLDRYKYAEWRGDFERYVFEQEITGLPAAVREEFGQCLELLTTRIAESNRDLQPEGETLRRRLGESDTGVVMLADVIFRRDEYKPHELRARCRDAVFACRDQDASAYITFLAAHELFVGMLRNEKRFNETDLAIFFQASVDFLKELPTYVEAVGTPAPVFACTDYLSGYFSDFDGLSRQWFIRSLAAAIADDPAADAYPVFCLLARHHNDVGWDARGTGWASEVADSAWPIFERETDLASKYYQAAFAIHPDVPRAPSALINIARTSNVGGTAKLWFNRCVAIQRDYYTAYQNYSGKLAPRWGGSNYHQMEFANVCIAADDFGPNGISWYALTPLRTARNSRGHLGVSLDEIPGYHETLSRLADGAIAAYDAGVVENCDFSGMKDMLYWLRERQDWERFRHLLSFGQPGYSWTYGDWIRGLGASLNDPARDEVMELYLAFTGPDRPVMSPEWLSAWRALVEQARAKTDSDDVLRMLDLCDSNIAAGEEYFDREWVKLSLIDDEDAGRVNFGADHVEYDDTDWLVLASGPNGSYPEVTVRPRLPGPMLIDSTFQPLRPDDSPYLENFGIVAGRNLWEDGERVSAERAVYVNNIWNAMGYWTPRMGRSGPELPDAVPVASWTGYRMGMLVTPTNTRAYWYMKEIYRDEIEFNEPFVKVEVRPLLNYGADRIFRVKNLYIRYCPSGEPPDDYLAENSKMHEKAAKRAAGEPF